MSTVSAEQPPGDAVSRRALTVVAGSRSVDVVVDADLTVGEVVALVLGAGGSVAVSVAGRAIRAEQTLREAAVPTGSIVLTTVAGRRPGPLEEPVEGLLGPTPQAAGAAYRQLSHDPGAAAGATSAPSSRVPLRPAPGTPAQSRLAAAPTAHSPAAGSSRAELAALGPTPAAAPERGRVDPSGPPFPVGRSALAVLAAGLATLGLYAVALPPLAPDGLFGPIPRYAVAAGLLLAGFGLGQPRGIDPAVRHTAPILGACAGALVGWVTSASALVAVVAACGGAALVALAGRTDRAADRRVPAVWASACGLVGALALGGLVLGASLEAVAVLLLGMLALLPRLLPGWVIDVADTVLVDIPRLSVTSWSPRERRRRPRSVWRIDERSVRALVATAMTTQSAALVALLVLTWGAAVVVGASMAARVGAGAGVSWQYALVLSVAAAGLAFGARPFRRRLDRVLLRAAGLGPAAALAVVLVAALPWSAGIAAAAAAGVLAAGLAGMSQAVAGGYSSLGLARLADGLEGASTVSAIPLALWACGALEWAQGLLG